jgi:hypothetical protein
MSAMPPISPELMRPGELTRSAKSGCEQSQQINPLFDHLVGAAEQRRRHFEAERFGGLEIDDELILSRYDPP